jgi:hypothetical protein
VLREASVGAGAIARVYVETARTQYREIVTDRALSHLSVTRLAPRRSVGWPTVVTVQECEGRVSVGPAHFEQVSSSDSIRPVRFWASLGCADSGPKR